MSKKTAPHEWKNRALYAERKLIALQKKLDRSDFKEHNKQMTTLNNNWQMKFDMVTQMFESVVNQITDNERHGRVLIESMRISIEDFHTATNMRETANALREVKDDVTRLVSWYDDIGYTGIAEWLKIWNQDLEAIDHNSEEAGELMDKIIKDHGFEFKPKTIGINWQEMA
ncbi:hypothetical protein THIOSC15_1400002 [uncultured Thiomicrorhabdus sp.]